MKNKKIPYRIHLLTSTALLLLVLLTGCGKKPPLAFSFNRKLSDDDSTLMDSMDSRTKNAVPVEIDNILFDLLTAATPIEPSITIPIFKNRKLVADIVQIDNTKAGQTTYLGAIRGQSLSSVTITRNDTIFTMDIHSEEGVFQVIYNGEYHELFQLELPGVPSVSSIDNIHSLPDLPQAETIQYPIDVLLLVSTDASASAGGFNTINNLINVAVQETNQGFLNSGINIHVAIVEIVETGGEPDSYSDALYCLVEKEDACLEAVHEIRDLVYADIVIYIMDNDESCGASWVNTTFNEYAETTAFGTVNWRCMTGYYGFAKEIGALLGAQTDRKNANYHKGAFPYSFGYQSPDESFRTIMALDCDSSCPRINYWSNPGITYNGKPVGVASGDNTADNHRTLNQTAAFVSDYRIPPSPPAKATIIAPGHNVAIIEQNPIFTWDLIYNTSEFIVELRKLTDGFLVESAVVTVTEACDPTICTHNFGTNLPPADYTWRVAGINSVGQGEWSDMNTFAIRHPAITPVSPINGAEIIDPTPPLSWLPSQIAPNYQILLANEFGTTIYDTNVSAKTLCSPTICTYEIPIPIEDGTYQWFVRAILTAPGIFGPPSTFEKVTPPAPETLSPVNKEALFNNNPIFRWYPYQLSTEYTIEITNIETQENLILDSIGTSACQDGLCEIILPIGLSVGNYNWKVQAFWDGFYYLSSEKHFSINALPSPIPRLPTNNYLALDNLPLLSWAEVNNTNTRSYLIEVIRLLTADVVYEYSIPKENCISGECKHQINGPLPPGEYQWRVRAVSQTINGEWSPYRTFTQQYTPGIPTPLLPENQSQTNTNTPILVWESGELAVQHEVEVLDIEGTTLGNWLLGNDQCDNRLCKFSIPNNLGLSTANQWKVRSIRNGIVGAWSEVFIFYLGNESEILFDFSETPNGWYSPTNKWDISDQSIYRGTAGSSSYFSAITYYDKYYANASFESKIRSIGTHGNDGFSILLRSQFNQNGDFLQGYTIDVAGSDTGIQISGWKISTAYSDSNNLLIEGTTINTIDIAEYHRYKLLVIQNTVELFVDDVSMYSMEIDPIINEGAFGFDVISHHPTDHFVDIDWVRITPLD